MADLIRDAPAGAILRLVFGRSCLPYPDELPCYNLPYYLQSDSSAPSTSASSNTKQEEEGQIDLTPMDNDIKPIVDWYDEQDPENPKNYSTAKKIFIQSQICVLTFAVYSSASIITPAEQYFQQHWGATEQTALLSLSLPLIGFAIGPLLFSPLSEIPTVGRNNPYLVSLSLFLSVTIAAAFVNDFTGFLIIRMLQGLLGSPVLATGAASSGDIFDLPKLPYALASWGLFAFGGPGLAPIIGGWATQYSTWRWSQYATLIIASVSWISLVFGLPETNRETILLRRARRLRLLTNRDDLSSESEIKQSNVHLATLMGQYLIVPLQITILDPSVLFINIYTALLYALFYSFFESFPIVYEGIYHFSVGQTSTAFVSLVIGSTISLVIYCTLVYLIYEPYTVANGIGIPEYRLLPGIFAAATAPAGVFIFAWTARADVHWAVPLTGCCLLSGSCAMLYMLIFLYLPLSYPRHSASLFAANAFLRSIFTVGAIHFAIPLFKTLGVGRGNSLLGGLLVGCFFAYGALWYFGSALRARSRFTGMH